MIFEQSLTVFQSITIATIIAVAFFLWRFYAFRKKYLTSLTQLPSIIVVGDRFSGKTSLTRAITRSEPFAHPLEDGLNMSYLKDGDKNLQFIDTNITPRNIEQLKKLSSKLFIYVFDASSNSDSLKNQIKNYENFRKIFNGIKSFAVLNKIDIAEKRTIKEIKDRLQNVYEISCKTNEGIDDLRKSILSSLRI